MAERWTGDRAAMAEADITPDFETELIGGWWREPVTREVLHPLRAQALVIENAAGRLCLIAIDSLGLTTALSLALRERVAARIGTDAARVMLAFSHTHEAPAPLSPVNGARYQALLFDRVTDCAARAAAAVRPCLAAWALGVAPVGEKRREGCTLVDDRLGVLRLTDAESGEPFAAVARMTAHANILLRGIDGRAVLSADWFGPARERMAGALGCPVMIVQGAAGNVKPVGADKIAGGGLRDVARVAEIAETAARGLRFGAPEPLRARMTCVEMDFTADVPSADHARAIADEAAAACGMMGDAWLAECARLRDAGVTEQRLRAPMQFLFAAGGALGGVPDEIFCETSLEASRLADAPLLFLNGYTNGCTGYLPTAAEWDKGGFEPLYSYLGFFPFHGHVTAFRRDTAARVAARAAACWRENGA